MACRGGPGPRRRPRRRPCGGGRPVDPAAGRGGAPRSRDRVIRRGWPRQTDAGRRPARPPPIARRTPGGSDWGHPMRCPPGGTRPGFYCHASMCFGFVANPVCELWNAVGGLRRWRDGGGRGRRGPGWGREPCRVPGGYLAELSSVGIAPRGGVTGTAPAPPGRRWSSAPVAGTCHSRVTRPGPAEVPVHRVVGARAPAPAAARRGPGAARSRRPPPCGGGPFRFVRARRPRLSCASFRYAFRGACGMVSRKAGSGGRSRRAGPSRIRSARLFPSSPRCRARVRRILASFAFGGREQVSPKQFSATAFLAPDNGRESRPGADPRCLTARRIGRTGRRAGTRTGSARSTRQLPSRRPVVIQGKCSARQPSADAEIATGNRRGWPGGASVNCPPSTMAVLFSQLRQVMVGM